MPFPLNLAPMKLSRIDRYFDSGEDLQPVLEKARKILALSKHCVDLLPPELASQLRGANIREETLVLLAANPAAAAKLKLLAGSLSESLLQLGSKVKGVSVRVQPSTGPGPVVAAHKTAALSPAALTSLADLRAALPDSPARLALDRLLAGEGAAQNAASSRSPKSSRREKSTRPSTT